MSKDTKFVIGIVILALPFGSIPAIVPLVFGIGVQSGAWSNQAIHSIVFLMLTRLSGLLLSVSIIGLALSLYLRKRNPKKFRLTSIAFAIILAGTILTAILSAWIDVNYVQAGVPASQTAMVYSSVTCISALVNVTSWIMLLIAIFSQKLNPADSMAIE